MPHILTDRALWRRYRVRCGQFVFRGCTGGRRISADGSLDVHTFVPHGEEVTYPGYVVPDSPIPPAPRFPRAGDGLDMPLLWVMLAFLLANVAAWIFSAVILVGWLLAALR